MIVACIHKDGGIFELLQVRGLYMVLPVPNQLATLC